MIRSIAQLKAWFRRGKYPTEEQFADWMDSYVHKEESEIPISQVGNLTEQLNGKYAATAGQELERQHNRLKSDYETHKQDSEAKFETIDGDIDRLDGLIADETERATGEEVKIRNEFAEADKVINEALKAEAARARKAEQDEKDRATAEETKLDGCIKEETRRATGVEGQLQAAITAEQSRATEEETAIRGEFAAADEKEKARATAEETKLDGKIEAETERATGVEGQLQTAITAEQSRAEAQEAAIRKDFAVADEKEKARAEKAEGILTTNLAAATADIDKIREMLKGGATLDEAKAALVELGDNYKDLHAVANTLKTFLEAKDTADSTINRWKEIEGFLSGITDTKTLTGLLEELETKITAAYNEAITNQTVTFTAAGSRTAPATGEKLSTIIGKIARWLADLKTIAFSGSAADVAETTDRKFVTPAEKMTWNGKASQAELTQGLEAKADKTELPGAITGQEIETIFNP